MAGIGGEVGESDGLGPEQSSLDPVPAIAQREDPRLESIIDFPRDHRKGFLKFA